MNGLWKYRKLILLASGMAVLLLILFRVTVWKSISMYLELSEMKEELAGLSSIDRNRYDPNSSGTEGCLQDVSCDFLQEVMRAIQDAGCGIVSIKPETVDATGAYMLHSVSVSFTGDYHLQIKAADSIARMCTDGTGKALAGCVFGIGSQDTGRDRYVLCTLSIRYMTVYEEEQTR